MNDKHDEPPQVPDGYGISIAYACLVDVVRAIQIEISPDIYQPSASSPMLYTTAVSCSSDEHHRRLMKEKSSTSEDNDNNEHSKQRQLVTEAKKSPLHEQIINSSWCGLLTAFCLLIESWYVISLSIMPWVCFRLCIKIFIYT